MWWFTKKPPKDEDEKKTDWLMSKCRRLQLENNIVRALNRKLGAQLKDAIRRIEEGPSDD